MKPRVLILVPTMLVGGTEMHTLAVAKSLAEAGYEASVCAYYESDPVMVRQFKEANVPVRLLGLRRGRGRNVRRMPRLAAALARLIWREQPDFVHVQYMAPGLVPVLVARMLSRAKLIVTVHVPGHHYGSRLWLPRSVVARLADAFLCVSQAAERSFFGTSAVFDEQLLRRGRKHFAIPNAVDLEEADRPVSKEELAELCSKLGIAGCAVVGMVSRLSPEKGPQDLIAAAPRIFQEIPEARLLIVGDGASRSDLQRQAASLGIAGRIIWAGRLPKQDVYRHLKLMDVVVAPSHFEGFGLATAEAMAMSKPVVASDIDGLREVVVQNQTGLLTPVEDSPALASAVIELLRSPQLRSRFGQAGRERVELEFSLDVFANRHVRLYAALAGAAPVSAMGYTGKKAGCAL